MIISIFFVCCYCCCFFVFVDNLQCRVQAAAAALTCAPARKCNQPHTRLPRIIFCFFLSKSYMHLNLSRSASKMAKMSNVVTAEGEAHAAPLSSAIAIWACGQCIYMYMRFRPPLDLPVAAAVIARSWWHSPKRERTISCIAHTNATR